MVYVVKFIILIKVWVWMQKSLCVLHFKITLIIVPTKEYLEIAKRSKHLKNKTENKQF